MNFKTILCPTDFSDRCLAMAEHGLGIARRFDARLLVVHIVESPAHSSVSLGVTADMSSARRSAAESRMHGFLQRLSDPSVPEPTLGEGDVAVEITRIAKQRTADLIMMPSWGHGPFRRFVFGSVAAKVLHDVSCPVMTGRHDAKAPPVRLSDYRRVACAIDLGEHSRKVLCWAWRFAQAWRAELTVLHAAPWVEVKGAYLEHLPAELRDFVVDKATESLRVLLKQSGCQAAPRVASAEPVAFVDKAARETDADVLVIGRSRRIEGVFGRLRSHAYAVIRTAPCPVISI